MSAVVIDRDARVALAHAWLEHEARAHDLDLLHLKGPALAPALAFPGRSSSDADVLVRPAHVAGFVEHLEVTGWRLVTGFESGSFFEHAANYHHDHWGYVDVHRSFPGLTIASEEAFDRLWERRTAQDVAHRPLTVPAELDQAMLLCLHAARGHRGSRAVDDLARVWDTAPPSRRTAIRERADAFGAGVALAAATGELDQHDDRTVDLWRYYADGGSRADEWAARLKAAPTRRAALRTALRGVRVNREFATMQLGHAPSLRELVGLFWGRVRTGAPQGVRRVRDRLRRSVRRRPDSR